MALQKGDIWTLAAKEVLKDIFAQFQAGTITQAEAQTWLADLIAKRGAIIDDPGTGPAIYDMMQKAIGGTATSSYGPLIPQVPDPALEEPYLPFSVTPPPPYTPSPLTIQEIYRKFAAGQLDQETIAQLNALITSKGGMGPQPGEGYFDPSAPDSEAILADWKAQLGPSVPSAPPYVPPDTEYPGPSGAPQWPPTKSYIPDEFALAEDNPLAYYMRRYQIPAAGRSSFQDWQLRQQGPSRATLEAYNILSPSGQAPMTWGTYLQNLRPGQSRKHAGQLFGRALQAPGGQQGFLEEMGDYFEPFMRNVLRNRYGSSIANRMIQRLGDYATRYEADATGLGVNFLDYLNKQYRIGAKYRAAGWPA